MHWTYPVPVRVKRCQEHLYPARPRTPAVALHNAGQQVPYLKLMKEIARGADHIVTVSEHSKRDIVALLGVPESKVTNTYQAVEIPKLIS